MDEKIDGLVTIIHCPVVVCGLSALLSKQCFLLLTALPFMVILAPVAPAGVGLLARKCCLRSGRHGHNYLITWSRGLVEA